MKIELKKNCKYSLLVPTSMGVRITPPNGQPVHSGGAFQALDQMVIEHLLG